MRKVPGEGVARGKGPKPSRGLEKHTQPSTGFWGFQETREYKPVESHSCPGSPQSGPDEERVVEKTKGIKSEWGLQFIFRHTQRVGGGQAAPLHPPSLHLV